MCILTVRQIDVKTHLTFIPMEKLILNTKVECLNTVHKKVHAYLFTGVRQILSWLVDSESDENSWCNLNESCNPGYQDRIHDSIKNSWSPAVEDEIDVNCVQGYKNYVDCGISTARSDTYCIRLRETHEKETVYRKTLRCCCSRCCLQSLGTTFVEALFLKLCTHMTNTSITIATTPEMSQYNW